MGIARDQKRPLRSGGRGHLGRASGLYERTHALAKIALADVQRWDEPNDLVVETAGDKKDVALERRGDRRLRDRLLVKLGRHHRAESPDLAQPRMRSKGSELFDHDRADGLGPRDEVLVAYDLERGEARRARDRVAAERRAVGTS